MADLPLLEVDGLAVEFRTRHGVVRALDTVSFRIAPGEILGLVGESGSGKSVSAYAVLGLLDSSAHIVRGQARFDGLDLLNASPAAIRAVRGAAISIIFQNPRAALNPTRSVGDQLIDVITAHQSVSRRAAEAHAFDSLRAVKIPDPERRLRAFPFELSGGTAQRVMIALALACSPKMLIADEPTTGLDVTTQAAIMDLIADLCHRRNMGVLFITHDLALASDYCDRIVVMHAGQVVETASTKDLFAQARHPYTQGLIGATLHPGATVETLRPVRGSVPDLRSTSLPPCRYAARCSEYRPLCDQAVPPLLPVGPLHDVACWRVQ